LPEVQSLLQEKDVKVDCLDEVNYFFNKQNSWE